MDIEFIILLALLTIGGFALKALWRIVGQLSLMIEILNRILKKQ